MKSKSKLKFLLGLFFVFTAVAPTVAFAQGNQRALLAYLKVQPGTEAQFLAAAKDVIIDSRREPGNLIYNLHEQLNDPQQFVFYELFRSDEDLQLHRQSRHVINFLNRVKPILLPGQFILVEFK